MFPFPFRFRALALPALILACAASPLHAGSVLGDDFNEDESHDYNGMPKLRLNLETGYSQWIYNPDSLTSDYENYLNTLESGWNFAADLVWFPWPKGGVGMTWIWFLSNAQENGVVTDSGSTEKHNLRDRASFVYYGPTFMSRLQFGRFGLLVGGFSVGWMDMHYTQYDNGETGDVKAGSLAVVANVGWEYACYRLVSLGVNARMLLSNIDEYTYNGEKVDINEGNKGVWNDITLTRFELDFGVRFGL
jgi:hypothetical protein